MNIKMENEDKKVEEEAQEDKPITEEIVEKTEEEKTKRRRRSKNQEVRDLGIGIDIGTGFCVSSTIQGDEVTFRTQRDAFFSIENNEMSKGMLDKLDANYIISEDTKKLFVVGEEALQMANVFNKETRRPLSKGCISTREQEALAMIKIIIHGLLGDPITKNEVCYFSIPAKPVDQDDYNVIYHENVLKSFIKSFGYDARPLNESRAIIFSELSDEDFTGMALSFGSGMTNFCLAFMGISENDHMFSVARAGDYIDSSAAAAVGLKASKITAIKEKGIDLLNPNGRDEMAIKIYYDNLIQYVCDALEQKLNSSDTLPNFPEPITIVLSGGTSKPINFDKVFEEAIMKKQFPFKVGKIKLASDQLNAVSKGCLLNALNNYRQE